MKNKKAIYILIPAVLLVWSIIFLKLYNRLNHNSDEYNMNLMNVNKHENFLGKTDDYKLDCNYPDPFLGSLIRRENLTTNQNRITKINIQNIIWPAIKVSGFVENVKNKKIKIWVTIGENSCLMALEDTNKSLKLVKIWRDSVQFEYEGAHKNFVVHK